MIDKAREPCVELGIDMPDSKVISLTEINLRPKAKIIKWSKTDSKA